MPWATKPCATTTEPIPGTTEAGHSKACALPQEESLQRSLSAATAEQFVAAGKARRLQRRPSGGPQIQRERLDLKNGKENTAGTKNLGSFRSSLAVQWLGSMLPLLRTQALTLAGELRSCKPQCGGEKKKFRFFKGSNVTPSSLPPFS